MATAPPQVFDKLGTFLLQWGKRGRKDGEFNYPSAIAVDDEGSVPQRNKRKGKRTVA